MSIFEKPGEEGGVEGSPKSIGLYSKYRLKRDNP